MSSGVTLVTVVTVLIFLLFLAFLTVAAIWLFRRARAVESHYWLAIALSICIAAIFLPESYGLIFWWFGESLQKIFRVFTAPMMASIECPEDCARYVLMHYVGALSDLASNGFDRPAGNAMPGIVLTLLLYVLFVTVYGRIRSGKISLEDTIISLVFCTTILFSFYLCLTALLTIPLMQKEAVQDGFSIEDLTVSLTNSMPSKTDFDARFPLIVLEDAGKSGDMDFVRSEIEKTNFMRTAIYQKLLDNKSQAIELFKADNAVGLGGREAVVHFSELVRWFILQRSVLEDALDICVTAARRAEFALQARANEPFVTSGAQRPIAEQMEDTLRGLEACSNIPNSGESLPARKSRADALPIVGNWSGWLIRSESMPLTIIVGLVGFSFLGASLSRIIRARKTSEVVWLSISDLLMVTISGASAALAVFVASYGGLAVISQSTDSSDPNPYIVFILCLAAAIYSEDVWAWLRKKFLEQINREKENTTPTVTGAAPPVVEPPAPEPK